jgi:hypothetical protein
MAIVGQAEPVGGREIIHAALSRRIRRPKPIASLKGSPKTGAALPVYRISRKGALVSKPLSRAKKIGWRYLIVGGSAIGLAVLARRSQRLEFGGIHEGALPDSLLKAAELAEQRSGAETKTFEPRLLEIPSQHVFALWMFAPRVGSFFIPLTGSGTESLRVVDKIEILAKTSRNSF